MPTAPYRFSLSELNLPTNERLIVALARNDVLEAQRIVASDGIDVEVVHALSERHKMTPLVFKRLADLTLPETIAPRIRSIAQRAVIGAMAVNMEVRREIRILADVLGKAGVDFLLLKGPAVTKDPLRRFNDLDILIHEDALPEAVRALERAGYRYRGSNVLNQRERESPFQSASWNNQFPYQSPRSRLCVEVHTNLFERDRIRLESLGRLLDDVGLFWERHTRDDELGCSVPARECTLALLCVHSALKRSPAHNTYVLRHAYDIVQLLAKDTDLDRLVELCGSWGIEYYACVALRLAEGLFDSPKARLVIDRLEPALTPRQARLADIHLRCFRGLGDAALGHRYRYALLMPLAIGGGGRKSMRWYREILLPPRWSQETRHGVSRNSVAIALTYLYGPFVRLVRVWRRQMERK